MNAGHRSMTWVALGILAATTIAAAGCRRAELSPERRPMHRQGRAVLQREVPPPAPLPDPPEGGQDLRRTALEDADPEPRLVDLDGAVRLALARELGLEADRLAALAAATGVVGEWAEFDPRFTADASWQRDTSPTASSLAGAASLLTTTTTYAAGLEKRTLLGGTARIEARESWQDTNNAFFTLNPTQTSLFTATYRQPLLRGFGLPANLADVRIARTLAEQSDLDVLTGALDTVLEVQQAYYELVGALRDWQTARAARESAAELLRRNRDRFEQGAGTRSEVTQARAQLARQDERVLAAENRIRAAEDGLRRLVFPLDMVENLAAAGREAWGRPIRPATSPEFEPVSVDLYSETVRALARRPEIRRAEAEVERLEQRRIQAENGRLPRLDLVGEGDIEGLGSNLDTSADDAISGEFPRFLLGLEFSWPLGNRGPRASLRRARLEVMRGEVLLHELRQSVVLEVRAAVRDIRNAEERVAAATLARELAEQQLDDEEARLREGLSTSFQVLEFQQDLADARSQETAAIIDHLLARARLRRAVGAGLDRHLAQHVRPEDE